jgi:hypothetical protein
MSRKASVKGTNKEQENLLLGQLKRISYNLRSELDVFVEEFVRLDGIKEIMYMIEECQDLKEYDMIYVAG